MILTGVLIVALCCLMQTPTSQKTQAIPLEVDRPSIDIGKISPQQKEVVSFALTNVSQSTVILLEPDSSCGCTGVQVNETRLKSGEKTNVIVNVDAGSIDGVTLVTIMIPYWLETEEIKKYLLLQVKFEVG
jgi:hypothetical protein